MKKYDIKDLFLSALTYTVCAGIGLLFLLEAVRWFYWSVQ